MPSNYPIMVARSIHTLCSKCLRLIRTDPQLYSKMHDRGIRLQSP